MERVQDFVQDRQGNALQGATVKAYEPFTAGGGAEVAVQMYNANVDAPGNQVNSTFTDSEGNFFFYVKNARVDLKITLGASVKIIKDYLAFDPEDIGIVLDQPFDAEATRWYAAAGAPTPEDPPDPTENDLYLDGQSGNIWVYTDASGWLSTGINIKGPIGPPGLEFAGIFSAGNDYDGRDWVLHDGSSYFAPIPIAAGTATPPSAPWILLAQKGDDANGLITGDHALYDHKRVTVASDDDDSFDISPLLVEDERQLAVYRNGVRQQPGDFSITGPPTSTVGTVPMNEGDILDFYTGTGTLETAGFQPTSEKGQADGYAPLDGSSQVPAAHLTAYQVTSQKGVASGYAGLDAGAKVPVSQLPAIAIAEVSVVGSEGAQLGLTAQEGDVAIRTDENKSYVHNGGSAGTMADWSELLTPTDAVLTVFGRNGAVTAESGDYAAFYEQLANKNDPNGYAGLDGSGLLAVGQIPDIPVGKLPLTDILKVPIVAESTTTRTLSLATDAFATIRCTNGSDTTITVPANATEAFAVGTFIHLRTVGAMQIIVAEAGGVTVNTPETLKSRKQGSTISLLKVAADVWDLTGDLEAL